MKLANKCVVTVPMLLLLSVVGIYGQTCPGGIAGVSSPTEKVCCPVGCGTCTGSGCKAAGNAAGLGPTACCGSPIMASNVYCSESNEAPCIIGEAESDTSDNFTEGEYGKEFSGDGTYYGYTTEGNCAFFDDVPDMYAGMIPVALGASQYGDSLMCGACVEGTASGVGSGHDPLPATFKGYISDKCPECSEGDLDFSMPGDGRWDIEWKFVPCPGNDLSFVSPSANPWYWKLQPRGTSTPVKTLTINGQSATRTDDNHFVRENSGSPWEGPQTVVTTTIDGVVETTQLEF